MDITQFRLDFPEFADDTVYTDSMCTYWSTLAENINDPARFGNVYTNIIELYTAHCLAIQEQNIQTANTGNVPGQESGAISSKKVGSVTLAYEDSESMEMGAGWFNLTKYGRQYLQLAKMFGSGGMMSRPNITDFTIYQGFF